MKDKGQTTNDEESKSGTADERRIGGILRFAPFEFTQGEEDDKANKMTKELSAKGGFQGVKLQRPPRATVCSHSPRRDMADSRAE